MTYSKAAQRIADELGVDLSTVTGTGKGGNVLVKDVEAAATSGGVRLGIVSKFWMRPAVSAFMQAMCLRLATVPGVSGLVCVGARSPGDPYPAAEVEGWEYVEAPNHPLSEKGNHASRALKGRVDAVLNLGSDDIVSPGYLERALALLAEGHDAVCPTSLVYHNIAGGETVTVEANRIGAGRLFSAALMERMGWEAWDPGRLPDVDSDNRLARYNAKRATLSGADLGAGLVVLDLKDGQSIGSFTGVTKRRLQNGTAAHVDVGAVLAACDVPAELWERLQADFAESIKPVLMRALVNIPGGMLGLPGSSRIERGATFEAPPHIVSRLTRYQYAEPA